MSKKSLILVFMAIFFFSGCFSKSAVSKDFFGDEVYQEKVLFAAKNYKELIRMYKEKLEKKDIPEIRIKLAQYYYESKDYPSSLYYLTPLVNDSSSTQALLMYAKTLEGMGKYDEALLYLEKLIALDSTSAEGYNLVGIVYAYKKDFTLAKKNFLEAKKHFLNDSTINTNLGMLAILEQNYLEAIDYLMPLYARGYKESKILNNLIFALVKSNKTNVALDIVTKENISKTPRKFIRDLQKIKMKK